MSRRKLKDLNLLDNFLFGSIMRHPDLGEPFGRLLLEIIFQRKFGHLKIVPQKIYDGKDTDLHGMRLDVYMEELPKEAAICQASVYDVEPDQNHMTLRELSRRTRFYHALIDGDCLKSGEDYGALKNVIVIFIMPNDPFGAERMIYTVCNMCREEPELPYNDGAQTLFLYTKGTKGNPPEALFQLLHYMESSVEQNAVNPNLKRIHRMVEAVKQNKEVELSYMKSWEWEKRIRETAQKEGHEEGLKEGREEGLKEGREEGLKEGREEGLKEGLKEGREEGLKEGLEEGRREERLNTEREKQRADQAEREKLSAQAKIRALEAELQKYTSAEAPAP